MCTGKKSNGEPCDKYANYRLKGRGQPRIFCVDHHTKGIMIRDTTTLCKIVSCPKSASYGIPGNTAEYCVKCYEKYCDNKESMENIKRAKCINVIDGVRCTNTPSFIPDGEKTPRYCKTCNPGNTFDKHEKCIICKNIQASWGIEGSKKRTHCADCAKKSGIEMILLGGGPKCDGVDIDENGIEKKCKISAGFGFVDGKPTKCKKHIENDMKALKGQFCKCGTRASFGLIGTKKPIYCNDCKPSEDYVAVGESRICGCGKRCCYGYIWDERPSRCSKCAEPDMENIMDKKCVKCKLIIPSYIVRGQRSATYCAGCADKNTMISIHKKCDDCGIKRASYGFRNTNVRMRCEDCSTWGMYYLERPKCEKCDDYAVYGFLFQKKRFCRLHKEKNMHPEWKLHPECEIDICDEKPFYCKIGDRYPTRCETHSDGGYINIIERNCSTCNLPDFIPKDKQNCRECDLWSDGKFNHTKELRIKHVLEGHNIKYTSYDRVPESACSKYRPDFIIDLGSICIILEVDENQHRSYPCECEEKRMMQIYQDFGGVPLVFIRYNPDDYKDNNGKKCEGKLYNLARETVLIKLINRIMFLVENSHYDIIPLSVYYLYYDGFNGDVFRSVIDYEHNSITNSNAETLE